MNSILSANRQTNYIDSFLAIDRKYGASVDKRNATALRLL